MITNAIYKDGFGENLKFIIYSIIYSEFVKKEFHYTPFTSLLEHNYDNDPDFLDKKEKMINLIKHYPLITHVQKYDVPDRLFLLHFFENNIEFCSKSKELQNLKTIININSSEKLKGRLYKYVGVHIRRMNQLDTAKTKYYKEIPGTDVPNYIYQDIINQIKHIYPTYKIHIYSQGIESDFQFGDNVILYLNESIEDTFSDLVSANILVVAPSSLSYSAALLSKGIVYTINCCNKPLPHWNIIQNYTSTKDRYTFFIPQTPTLSMKIYYDTTIGQFYREDKSMIREYINIHDFLRVLL